MMNRKMKYYVTYSHSEGKGWANIFTIEPMNTKFGRTVAEQIIGKETSYKNVKILSYEFTGYMNG